MALELALSKEFTSQQRAFIVELVRSGDKKDAAIKAGYSPEYANDIALQMLQQPAIVAAIQIGVARDLAIGAIKSNRVLQEFVEDEKLDKRLRYACAKTILDRAGHIAPKATAAAQNGAIPLNEMSMADLRALADKLEGEIAGRAKEVSSADVAPDRPQTIEDIM